MRILSFAATAAATAALASCTTSPQVPAAIHADQQVQQMLAGKVAGAPISCVPSHHGSASKIIAPNAIAFRVDSSTVYVSNTAGMGCEGLAGTHHALVTRSTGPGGLCRGDIVEVRDLHSGSVVGSCTLGDFVRYSRR